MRAAENSENMTFLQEYMRERGTVLAFTAGIIAVFAGTLLLMGVEPKMLLYPTVLCVFLSAAALAVDAWKHRNDYISRRDIEKITLSIDDSLPEATTFEGLEYQQVIRRLMKEYRAFVNGAEARYDSMTEYYTVWAHQIKTPISSMRLALADEDSSLARRLSSDLLRIEQYADMVLVYLRLDSESTDYVFTECNVGETVKRAVKRFAVEFIDRKLSFSCDETLESMRVISDSKWLGFVIEQLLSNSLKYTKTGGIRIWCREAGVLVIEDSGIGIAPQDLPRIFEKGYTGYNGRTGDASGIGLYLCRRVCQNLHIGLSAESEVGVGTKMILDLKQYKLRNE